MDDDTRWPTICGTGTEDYFGGAWAFSETPGTYSPYTTPWLGLPQVLEPSGIRNSQYRFRMYRWNVQDPIRYAEKLRVTLQAIGWHTQVGGKPIDLPLQDDIASTVFWYQAEPHALFPTIGGYNELEVT